jgi:LacI family transcriptional regulator, repressor for deo operon, udp, cdd, tsx, nupC, and nupG
MSNIYDVAKRAGVSPSTVSRVLSRPDLVSAGTRARVTSAVDLLEFIPNSTAKSLRRASTRKLLVTVPDISNPFFSLILQGIEGTAQRHDYSVLVGDTQSDSCREERYGLMLKSKEADGLIFLGHRLPESAAALARTAAPRCAPIVNGCEFNPRLGVPSVHIDNARAAADVMHLLHDLGHQRIGVITGPLASPLSRDRLRGATTTARRSGGSELLVVHGDFSVPSGIQAARELLDNPRPPTAIFCFNDEMAMGVLDVTRERRLKVPRDVSVVGFDDIRFAQYTYPSLTTISQPMRAIGEGTVRLLLSIIDNPAATPQSVTLPHSLVTRESTAIAPTRR